MYQSHQNNNQTPNKLNVLINTVALIVAVEILMINRKNAERNAETVTELKKINENLKNIKKEGE